MTQFLTDYGPIVALVCAGCAVLYGIVTSRWLLSLSPGNEQMREISAAVQEGAKAYLNRQYTIIAGVELLPVRDNIKLMCEPGRALVAEAESLIVRVDARRGNNLYINDGSYGMLFDAAHPDVEHG